MSAAMLNGSDTIGSLPITILLMVIYQHSYRHYYPAFEVGVETAARRYGEHLRFESAPVTRADLDCDCMTANIVNLASKHYYRNKLPNSTLMSITYGCSPNIQEIAPLFLGWDAPFLTVAGNPSDMHAREIYSTVLSLGAADNSVMQDFIRKLLIGFEWRTVFLLCDSSPRTPNNFYRNNCAALKRVLGKDSKDIRVFDLTFNSFSPNGINHPFLFQTIAQNSRVVVLLAECHIVRKLMIFAFRQNMTTENYVYIFPQPFLMFTDDGYFPLSWQYNDDEDQVAREAFHSILYVLADTDTLISRIPRNDTVQMLEKMKAFSIPAANAEELVQLPVFMASAYEAVNLIAKTTTELITNNPVADPRRSISGRVFKSRLSNRTLNTPTGSVFISKDGSLVPNYVLKQMNRVNGLFENVILYDGTTQLQTTPYGRQLYWRGGTPPLSEPKCGFDGMKEECRTQNRASSLVVKVLLPAFGLLIAMGVAAHWLFKVSEVRSRASTFFLDLQYYVVHGRSNIRLFEMAVP